MVPLFLTNINLLAQSQLMNLFAQLLSEPVINELDDFQNELNCLTKTEIECLPKREKLIVERMDPPDSLRGIIIIIKSERTYWLLALKNNILAFGN